MRIFLLSVLLAAPLGRAPLAQASPMVAQVLGPALAQITHDLGEIDPGRWKLSAPLRDQTAADLQSIAHDLDTTLPPLIAASDQQPNQPDTMLPVSRNITALYDVLVRLTERARTAPPAQQAALEDARASLDAARRTFDQELQAFATTWATTVKQTQAAPAPPPCPPPPAVKKKAKAKAST